MKNGNKIRWAWSLAVILFPFVMAAQNASRPASAGRHEFSVQQAIDYAEKNNVQVRNALLDMQIQAQTNREVTAAAYPQVSASGSFVYNAKLPISLLPAEIFGGAPGTYAAIPFGLKYSATGGFNLNQLLFDGQVFVGLQARSTVMKFSEKNVEVTKEMIKTNIYKIYYQLVVSKQQIELLDANIERIQKLLHDTKIIYDNGFAEKLDVDKVNVGLVNLQTEKTKALNLIDNGYFGLKLLMGMPTRDQLILTDTLSYEQIRENVLDPGGFQYTDRKEFQYAQLGVKLGEYNIRRYKLAKLPTLSLNGYYNKNAFRNEFDFFQKGAWYSVSAFTLNLNVPIFTGFSNNAKIRKAQLELQKSVNQQEWLKISIDNEIETARNSFRSAITSLDYQRKNMELAETVYQQTKKKYESGLGSQTEINTAQTELKTAQTNYITALYDAIIAKVDFLKATGKL
jgi:outer membrane protein